MSDLYIVCNVIVLGVVWYLVLVGDTGHPCGYAMGYRVLRSPPLAECFLGDAVYKNPATCTHRHHNDKDNSQQLRSYLRKEGHTQHDKEDETRRR